MADLHVSSMNGLVGRLPFMGMKLLEEGAVWVEGQELSMGPPNFKVLYENQVGWALERHSHSSAGRPGPMCCVGGCVH